MAKWTVGNKGGQGTLKGTFEYDSGQATGESRWQVYQDEKPFLEQAKMERDLDQRKDTGYRKFATIPDIVALEILQNHGIDLHDPNTMQDRALMNKFRSIIKSEYKYLLSF
jgi:hypothetical protein